MQENFCCTERPVTAQGDQRLDNDKRETDMEAIAEQNTTEEHDLLWSRRPEASSPEFLSYKTLDHRSRSTVDCLKNSCQHTYLLCLPQLTTMPVSKRRKEVFQAFPILKPNLIWTLLKYSMGIELGNNWRQNQRKSVEKPQTVSSIKLMGCYW